MSNEPENNSNKNPKPTSQGRIRRRKRPTVDQTKRPARIRKRPLQPDANDQTRSAKLETPQNGAKDQCERKRDVPKQGRSYRPLIWAKNGKRLEELPYDEGYGKPPENSKFKTGQSGNPNGRPKGKKNTNTLFNEALDQKILSRAGGKEKKISAREGIVQRSIQKALEGDPRFVKLVMEKDNGFELQALMEDMQSDQDENLDTADEAILEEFIRQIEEDRFDQGSEHAALDIEDDNSSDEEDDDDNT